MKSIVCISVRRWGVVGLILALLLAHMVLTGGKVLAQGNLVPNPSFETNSGIPTAQDQLNLAVPWFNPNIATPDYFHSSALATSGVDVPGNDLGSQFPHPVTGKAYAGFHLRSPTAQYREYVETPLSSPLVAGKTYQVSFYVSLADRSQWAIDKIGAHFSTIPIGPVNNVGVLPYTPQVNNPPGNYITDKVNWTLITGLYFASGGEDNLVIGNFFDDLSTPPLMGQGGPFPFAYYYLDDVSVIPASDLGDAPDSTNHGGVSMNTNYSPNNQAHFPTVFNPPSPGPAGPLHLDAAGFAWLGPGVSFEEEADTGWDQDGFNNINYLIGNQDLKDDGLISLTLQSCALSQFQFSATNASQSAPVSVYINTWFDWTSDGDWDDAPRCAADPVTTVLAPEWAVQNYAVTLAPGFNNSLLTPLFWSLNPPGKPVWMRITLTDAAINAANHGGPFTNPADLGKGGSGPAGGYQFGETEDYFLGIEPVPTPGVGDWGVLTLVLGLTGAFLLLIKRRRRALP